MPNKKDILMYIAIGLSLTGGQLIAMTYAFEGHAIWIVSNLIWLRHFWVNKDIWAVRMYIIFLFQALIGAWMWS